MATPPTIGRRIKAAMALAGYSIEDLSEAIGQRGLGPRTLRKLQDDSDPREPRAWELRAIADACGVPYSWFTIDDFAGALNGTSEPSHEDGDLAARVAAIEGQLKALAGDAVERVAPRPQEAGEQTQEDSPRGTRSSPSERD